MPDAVKLRAQEQHGFRHAQLRATKRSIPGTVTGEVDDVRVLRSENVTPRAMREVPRHCLESRALHEAHRPVLSDYEDDDGQPGAEGTRRIGRPDNLRHFVGCAIAGDVSKAS